MPSKPKMYVATVCNDIEDVEGLDEAESVIFYHFSSTSGLAHQRNPSPPVVSSILRFCQTAGDESQEHCDGGNTQTDSIRDGNVSLTTLMNVSCFICNLRGRRFSHNSMKKGWYSATAGEDGKGNLMTEAGESGWHVLHSPHERHGPHALCRQIKMREKGEATVTATTPHHMCADAVL